MSPCCRSTVALKIGMALQIHSTAEQEDQCLFNRHLIRTR